MVWYALITVEAGKVKHESHASSGAGIYELVRRLKSLDAPSNAVLFGVWTGQYTTNLFVLDIPTAISRLEGA